MPRAREACGLTHIDSTARLAPDPAPLRVPLADIRRELARHGAIVPPAA
jgi:hypothetical protein